jgi:(p)ppGpp synthase/HD superfamily hydrolase
VAGGLEDNELEDPDFETAMRSDIFTHRVFVFTPKGDVVDLPAHATPIDFAYAIHSDLGNHVSGAKVNGKMVPLDMSSTTATS